MKFEKFFKSAGTHGLIVKKSEVETWLVCGDIGMRIPDGVNNLGVNKDPEGKANDIIRVFETDLGDRIGIYNASYGLLEKKDRLTYLEIEEDDPDNEGETKISKFIVVRDYNNEVIGFIAGSNEI